MRKRIAIVEKEKCHPLQCPGTYYCMRVCPSNRMGKECKTKDVDGKIKINEELSSDACRICVKACPFGAIHIVNLPETLSEDPVHRYGQNSFELFRLPMIKKGMVIGILGRNGIGKSTALQILSGAFVPNFGKWKEGGTHDEVQQRYSKTLWREYFTGLYDQELRVSYKPQRVELLTQAYTGKVGELLQRVDERGKSLDYLKLLDATQLLEKDLRDLSGGELQKIAIVAASVKNADVYYFDEPSSFLDITSRIAAARLIKSLTADGQRSVLVVEHDLATLDYISDEIQIVYGKQACYGVFTPTKAVRRGINEYLDGYLAEDNIRFRDYHIRFSRNPVAMTGSTHVMATFSEVMKTYPGFSLVVQPGKIFAGEVLGIMGANGLGKSTFLKMVAGILKPDRGEITSVKISYKPQQLSSEEDVDVQSYLKECGAQFSSGWYAQNILEKLNIQPLLQHKLSYLSGGELQKVLVAGCLSRDADVFVLDEPSAFIDVEDRLHIAEVIKEFTETKKVGCVVVDHDVQFMDYLADKMIVFEGTPAVEGRVFGPCSKEEGMNRVLKMLEITFRKDKETNRARINKPGSQLDTEQKSTGKYYYA